MNPANYKKFYVISYQHSQNGELCFWRENNAGYTNDLQQAGKYSQAEIEKSPSYYSNGYYDKRRFVMDNVAVPCDELEATHKIVHKVERSSDMIKLFKKRVKKIHQSKIVKAA